MYKDILIPCFAAPSESVLRGFFYLFIPANTAISLPLILCKHTCFIRS